MRIGELARRTGTTPKALRLYEARGLLGTVARTGSYRQYGEADVARVQPAQTEKLAVVTQTTLSVDDAAQISAAVRARFPLVREPKQQDICYATQNR